ncbi:MAG: hypothetical protein ACYCU0_06485 [Solirubrobacteraceae bacterium]
MSYALLPSAADLELVRWVGEQYGANTDQLMRAGRLQRHSLRAKVRRLRDAELVEVWPILAGEPPWVTPTARGLRACGSPFAVWRPRLDRILHISAVTEVRLHVQGRDPEAEWVCERQLDKDRAGRSEHLPDALVATQGRSVAIEVELSPKTRRQLERILSELADRHDAVLYFCTPQTARAIAPLVRSGRWPALDVRPIPAPVRPWMR